MTVNVYRSSDAGAPALTGQPGTVIAIFDACLVNGYGSKAAAGWDKPYSAANVGVYRAGTGNRMYLRVDDTAAQEARIQGYETMSSVSAGTGPFPTSGQLNGGPFVRKSETADATTRSWMLIATDKLFYFLPTSNVSNWLLGTTVDYMSGWMKFGEFTSYKAGDAYNTVISGGSQTSSSYGYFGHNARSTTTYNASPAHYTPRSHLQVGGASTVGQVAILDPTGVYNYFGVSSYYPPFPESVVGGMPLSPIALVESIYNGTILARGTLPGIWAPLTYWGLNHGDTLNGAGELAAKTFQITTCPCGSSNSRLALEISDTW